MFELAAFAALLVPAGASAATAPLGADTISTPTGRDKDPDRTRSRVPVRAVADGRGGGFIRLVEATRKLTRGLLKPTRPRAP